MSHLPKFPWRTCATWCSAIAFGELAGAALGAQASMLWTGVAVFVAALGGALGSAAILDALAPLPTTPADATRACVEPSSSAWNFNYQDAEPDEAWSSDLGRSQVAWAEATLAARDAWERAARNSRTRVVLGKRVVLGDPPPRTGDDT